MGRGESGSSPLTDPLPAPIAPESSHRARAGRAGQVHVRGLGGQELRYQTAECEHTRADEEHELRAETVQAIGSRKVPTAAPTRLMAVAKPTPVVRREVGNTSSG